MKIILGADLVVTDVNKHLFESGNAEKIVGKKLYDVLASADYRIFNLEMAFIEKNTPITKCGPNLGAPTNCVNGYKTLKTDLLCLANNHVLDFGYEGLFTTLKTLDNAGISKIGAGFNQEEAEKPFIIEKDGVKVGIYNCCEHEFSWVEDYGFGCNGFDDLETPDKIKALKDSCDYVIVIYHGGKEHYQYPSPRLRKVCRKLTEKGADLVLCQHTHCVGCEEDYAGGKIIYGQGNFVFNMDIGVKTWGDGFLVNLEFDDKNVHIDYIPYIKTEVGVSFDNSGNIMKDYKKRSEEIKNDGFVEKKFEEMAESTVLSRYVTPMLGKKPTEEDLNKVGLQLFHCAECEVHRECLLTGLRKLFKLGKYGEFDK